MVTKSTSLCVWGVLLLFLLLVIYDKVNFLDLRGALSFLGTLDSILWDGKKGFGSLYLKKNNKGGKQNKETNILFFHLLIKKLNLQFFGENALSNERHL